MAKYAPPKLHCAVYVSIYVCVYIYRSLYLSIYLSISISLFLSVSLSHTLSPSLRKEIRHKVLITYSTLRKARIINLQLQFFPVGDLRKITLHEFVFFSEYNM